jgi:Acyl transferase domain
VARAIWDRADEHFLTHYGFSIVDIVRNNPKELTVYFGGPKGKAIRQNYLNMVYEQVDANGVSKVIPIFKGIDENSTFYKFVSPTGLLSATQFTQPALTLMEKAAFEDMKAKGLVQTGCAFAGHSLGEYSALAAIGDVLPIESLVDIVFYRGLTMQVAVVCPLETPLKLRINCFLVPGCSGPLGVWHGRCKPISCLAHVQRSGPPRCRRNDFLANRLAPRDRQLQRRELAIRLRRSSQCARLSRQRSQFPQATEDRHAKTHVDAFHRGSQEALERNRRCIG